MASSDEPYRVPPTVEEDHLTLGAGNQAHQHQMPVPDALCLFFYPAPSIESSSLRWRALL